MVLFLFPYIFWYQYQSKVRIYFCNLSHCGKTKKSEDSLYLTQYFPNKIQIKVLFSLLDPCGDDHDEKKFTC